MSELIARITNTLTNRKDGSADFFLTGVACTLLAVALLGFWGAAALAIVVNFYVSRERARRLTLAWAPINSQRHLQPPGVIDL